MKQHVESVLRRLALVVVLLALGSSAVIHAQQEGEPAKPAERTEKKDVAPIPEPPQPPRRLGPANVINTQELVALWKRSATSRKRGIVTVREALQISITDEGECEFPSFSPKGDILAFLVSRRSGGRMSQGLRLLNLNRAQNEKPSLLTVRSPSRRAVALVGLRKTDDFGSHDSQVYFSWASALDFVYYSRVHEKIFRAKFKEKGRSVAARLVAARRTITLQAAKDVIYYQDRHGITDASRGNREDYIVKIGKPDATGTIHNLATMPAACPANPRVFAFISRVRGAPTTDLCIRFDNDTIARITTDRGWEKLPTWSPDGRYVAFYSTETSPHTNEYGIWAVRVNLNSRNVGGLFSISGDDQISPQDLRDAKRTGGPCWSPNSKQVLYFAKSRRASQDEDVYLLRAYDIRYGDDEGSLTVKTPSQIKLNSPGDLTCSPAGGLVAFSNAVTQGRQRDFRVVVLHTNLPGRKK